MSFGYGIPRISGVDSGFGEQTLTVGAGGQFAHPYDAWEYIQNLALEGRWELVKDRNTSRIDITAGTITLSKNGANATDFTDLSGDLWIAINSSSADFTASKFYRISAIVDDDTIILDHDFQENTASAVAYKIYRPIHFTVLLYPGVYERESVSTVTNACHVTFRGISHDAQWICTASGLNIDGALIRHSIESGYIGLENLYLGTTEHRADGGAGSPNTTAHAIVRGDSGTTPITDFLMDSCRIQTTTADVILGTYGTSIIRNNVGIISVDGIANLYNCEKAYVYNNNVRSIFNGDITLHGHGCLAIRHGQREKSGANQDVQIFNNCFVTDATYNRSIPTYGITWKTSGGGNADANIVIANNRIKLITKVGGTSRSAAFYGWQDTIADNINNNAVTSISNKMSKEGTGTYTDYLILGARINAVNQLEPDDYQSSTIGSGMTNGAAANQLINTTQNFVTLGVIEGMELRNISNPAVGYVDSITTTTNPNDTINVVDIDGNPIDIFPITNLYAISSGVIYTTTAVPTSTGVPSGGESGDEVLDTSNSRIYFNVSGTWKYAALT